MYAFLSQLLDTNGFPARWHCGSWTPGHGWLHILSDCGIFGAYMAIPIGLAYFTWKRNDVPFQPVFWLFVAFIASCGVGHLIEATIFWHPWYRLSGVVKLITALVSWATVIALVPIIPRALALPGLAESHKQLEVQTESLLRTNDDLERFTRNVVGREARILELKREVNELLDELGRHPRYQSVLADR